MNDPTPGHQRAILWTAAELGAIDRMAGELELTPLQVLRQALRLYQLYHHRQKAGETCTWSGDAERAREFAGTQPQQPDREGRELHEAALRLRDHAWLSRFRKANYENQYNNLSPDACRQIAGYVDEFLVMVLKATAAGEVERLREKLQTAERNGYNPMLAEYCDEFMRDALVAIAGAVCTPERGYIEDGGMQLLLHDIKTLRKQHDMWRDECNKLRDKIQTWDAKAAECYKPDPYRVVGECLFDLVNDAPKWKAELEAAREQVKKLQEDDLEWKSELASAARERLRELGGQE